MILFLNPFQEVTLNVELGGSIYLEGKVEIFFIEKDHTPKSFLSASVIALQCKQYVDPIRLGRDWPILCWH